VTSLAVRGRGCLALSWCRKWRNTAKRSRRDTGTVDASAWEDLGGSLGSRRLKSRDFTGKKQGEQGTWMAKIQDFTVQATKWL